MVNKWKWPNKIIKLESLRQENMYITYDLKTAAIYALSRLGEKIETDYIIENLNRIAYSKEINLIKQLSVISALENLGIKARPEQVFNILLQYYREERIYFKRYYLGYFEQVDDPLDRIVEGYPLLELGKQLPTKFLNNQFTIVLLDNNTNISLMALSIISKLNLEIDPSLMAILIKHLGNELHIIREIAWDLVERSNVNHGIWMSI